MCRIVSIYADALPARKKIMAVVVVAGSSKRGSQFSKKLPPGSRSPQHG